MKVTTQTQLYAGQNAIFGPGVCDTLRSSRTDEGYLIVEAEQTADDLITLTVEMDVETPVPSEETADIVASETQETLASVYVGTDLSALTGSDTIVPSFQAPHTDNSVAGVGINTNN